MNSVFTHDRREGGSLVSNYTHIEKYANTHTHKAQNIEQQKS